MIELEEVHTYYGNSHILHGVSLAVDRGQCMALIGRNGAGKTTTIHSISGLVQPEKGSIHFDGQSLNGRPPHSISQSGIGLVPQGRRIFSSLSVEENLLIAERDQANKEGKRWTKEEIYSMFPILRERANNMGNQLSGGQQQMLAIGRALLTNPSFLLMDEPSEGLAPVIIEQIKNIILELKSKGLSMLVVEQNLELACAIADHVAVMNKGVVVWEGTPDQLLSEEEVLHTHLGV
ncbi:ABC transporter ATP-binding protein [Alteribacillus iranensis]|uniref:Amino acid/amide ABC transporter ATP-binding protein 2, HAAT family n=1 Tax=Alteribacillus iranensis TaxID=930128 RepID=A0A1I2F2F4_9BACI|nr:ABC transporter ATP-binding protein [Alteribacillus iranensis]SFE98690.1 amino acid/amide ABC transporter ATP-binding protein 2, HAAT family [Alteribacillus iranensis]